MKAKYYFLALTLVALLLAIPAAALASDISGAAYRGVVTVSNNSTTSTGELATFDLNTQTMIDLGYFSASLDNIAMTSVSGVDIPYMPSVNASYPWAFYVDAIGTNSVNTNYLYAKDATGGDPFMITNGLTVADNATLELGNSFNVTMYNVMLGTAPTVMEKTGAIAIFDDEAGTIMGGIPIADSATAPTNAMYVNAAGATRAGQRIDSLAAGTYNSVRVRLIKANSPTGTAYIRMRDVATDSIIGTFGSVDVSTISTSYTWYEYSTPVVNPSTQDVRITFEYSGGDAVNAPGIAYYSGSLGYPGDRTRYTGSWTDTGGEDAFCYIPGELGTSVSASYTAGTEYDVTLRLSGGTFYLDLNSVNQDSTAYAGSITNNANDWTLIPGVPCQQIDISVSGTPVFSVSYQYAEEWTDTVSGITVTPDYLTMGTNANISAVFSSFLPVQEATAPGYTLNDQTTQISYNNTMSGSYSTNLTYGPSDFPLSGVIEAIANAGQTPTQLPIVIIASVITLIASLTISGFMKQYGSGGIFPKFFVIIACMGIFTALGWFDFWMIAVFVVEGIAIMFMSKQIGWS